MELVGEIAQDDDLRLLLERAATIGDGGPQGDELRHYRNSFTDRAISA